MSNVFRGGVPYAIDVNRLKETFPVTALTEGTVIRHEQLTEIVKAKKGEQRYYGVVNSWIAEMKNKNGIFIVWEPSVGIKVLAPAETFSYGETKIRQKVRGVGRACGILRWVPRERLDAIGQQRYDHEMRVVGALKDDLTRHSREMAIDLAPIKSLPKPKLAPEAIQ